ncbi:MAG: hypothetical protein VB055_00245 [Oscillospiraceae bacterium]|nr:hypothetical protein [Oscillospiraceae bacterium]
MNREDLFDAIGGIQDRYIEEADPEQAPRRTPRLRRMRPYLSAAAGLVLVIGLALLGKNTLLRSKNSTADVAMETAAEPFAAARGMESAGAETTAGQAASGAGNEGSDGVSEDQAAGGGKIAEKEASEVAVPELTLPLEWNGECYAPTLTELAQEIPEGTVLAGSLSAEEGSEFYLSEETLAGAAVYRSAMEPYAFYVSYADGWQCYQK